VRVQLGLILMILGIVGIAPGSIGIVQHFARQFFHGDAAPLPALAAAFLLVGGVIIFARRGDAAGEDLQAPPISFESAGFKRSQPK
jgi:hypothetical protein